MWQRHFLPSPKHKLPAVWQLLVFDPFSLLTCDWRHLSFVVEEGTGSNSQIKLLQNLGLTSQSCPATMQHEFGAEIFKWHTWGEVAQEISENVDMLWKWLCKNGIMAQILAMTFWSTALFKTQRMISFFNYWCSKPSPWGLKFQPGSISLLRHRQ